MIPEISDNPTFLRYHQIWRANPSSIIFAPLAEMLILHKCYEEAINVCKKGLEKNPKLISGKIAIARAYIGVKNYKRAKEESEFVLGKFPDHAEALEILKVSEGHLSGVTSFTEASLRQTPAETKDGLAPSRLDPGEDNRWYTATMAEIYASQGNIEMAKKIYNGLLQKEPENARAKEGLDRLINVKE